MLSVKFGDAKKLKWNLGRDLTGVTDARVIIARTSKATPAVDRNGVIEDAGAGIVSLTLAAGDYGTGKLEKDARYYVEIETLPGPLTHPDDSAKPYEQLHVIADLG